MQVDVYSFHHMRKTLMQEERIMAEKKKVILAYSGGLDTSIIIPWLKENYDFEVIAVAGDVGQGEELEPLKEKAIKTGASKIYIEDLRVEFVMDFIFPTIKAQAPGRDRPEGGRDGHLPRVHGQGQRPGPL